MTELTDEEAKALLAECDNPDCLTCEYARALLAARAERDQARADAQAAVALALVVERFRYGLQFMVDSIAEDKAYVADKYPALFKTIQARRAEMGTLGGVQVFGEIARDLLVLADADGLAMVRELRDRAEKAEQEPFQERVRPWMLVCFGEEVSNDRLERGDRLLEEVLELLQSGEYPKERVVALLDYVWSRPKGEPVQEVGGVMVTLAAYCLAHGIDMHDAAETELARIWTKVEKIRAKQAAKPKGSALPQAWPQNAELAAAQQREAALSDPICVHVNMLRGTIAKPTLEQIIHLYGVDALCKALMPVIVREAEAAIIRKGGTL